MKKLISTLAGPFDESGKLVPSVKLNETYYYEAHPNQKFTEAELKAIHWVFHYNKDSEKKEFKNAVKKVDVARNICRLSCAFKKQADSVSVYAFIQQPSGKVCITAKIDNPEMVAENNQDDASSKDISKTYENRAPWMKIAIEKAIEMKGTPENDEPMYSNAKKFLEYCHNNFKPTDGINGPWCAAFLKWCLGQTKNPNTGLPYKHDKSASSLSPLSEKTVYKKIDEPIYGCIVVYKHNSQYKGHTGFLLGKNHLGGYILLGGNQDNRIQFSSYGQYTSNSQTKKIHSFYIPIDYEIKQTDYLTSNDVYDNGDNNTYNDGEIPNKLCGIKTTGISGGTT